MLMKKLLVFAFCFVYVSVAQAQLRVVNYNVHFCSADMEAMKIVLDATSLDNTHGEAIPVSVFMFQEVKQGAQKTLHGLVGESYSMGTYTNSGESGGAQAMFFHSHQFVEKLEDHKDIYTGATRNADRWHLIGIDKNQEFDLWVYSAHLKASRGTENKLQREEGVQSILEDIASLPDGANIIVAGDMNFYTVKEPAYQLLVSSLVDPLGAEEWAGVDDADKHTQSPRKIQKGGLASGGLDDRFDFQFISTSLQDGIGLDIIAGSYHSLGNDGNHFDVAINDGKNVYFANEEIRSNILATALHDASDHIPVIADYDVIKIDVPLHAPETLD
jgi:endonuclease/exonuclease/phosphatase family metal-dependent hydrolase